MTGKPYQDLASAFSEVKDGETIRLEKNVQLDNTVNINKSTTLDLNGKTITSDTVAFKAAIQDGIFTIKDSKENGKITSSNKSNLIEIREGELVVEGGELSNDWYVVYVYQSGKATIHGGTLVSDVASAVSTNGSAAGQENYSGNAVITITGGEEMCIRDSWNDVTREGIDMFCRELYNVRVICTHK